jgi:hypothetical protein
MKIGCEEDEWINLAPITETSEPRVLNIAINSLSSTKRGKFFLLAQELLVHSEVK